MPLLCLLPSAIYAGDLQKLVSASNDFEVQMIEHEDVLERNPSASELAQSALKYARAKERYFVELRKSVPILIDMATGKAPKTQDLRQNTGDLFWIWRSSGKAIGGCYGLNAEAARGRRGSLES